MKQRHESSPLKRTVRVQGGRVKIGDRVYREHIEFEVFDIPRPGKASIRLPSGSGAAYVVGDPVKELSLVQKPAPVVTGRHRNRRGGNQ